MDIQLNGYYDKNLGDDIMQRIIVRAFPEHTFYIKPIQREMMAHLENESNVRYGTCNDVMVNVIGTGFLFNSKMAKLSRTLSNPKLPYKHCAVVDCSIEPPKDKLSAWFTKDALSRYSHISCRDSYSDEFIRKDTKKKNVYFYPDIVFSENVPKRCGEALGIAPVRKAAGDTNYSYYKKLAEAADCFVERYNRKVLLFAFDNGMENDVSACGSIKYMMKHNEMAEIVIYNSDIDYFYSRMAECGKMISSRFHSAVLSLLAEIPLICISHTNKLRDLSNVFGMTYLDREDDIKPILDFISKDNEPIKIENATIEEAKKHITSLKHWLEEIG